MNRIIIVDLDSTIALAGERRIFFHTDPKNYQAAEAGVIFDDVIPQVYHVVKSFYDAGDIIVFLTARTGTDICRKNTTLWLENNSIPFHHLYMREVGDYSKDYICKRSILQKVREEIDGQVVLALEDREDVANMFNEEGITTFLVKYIP